MVKLSFERGVINVERGRGVVWCKGVEGRCERVVVTGIGSRGGREEVTCWKIGIES